MGPGNLRFALYNGTVRQFCIEQDFICRRRNDFPADFQDLARRVHSALNVSQDFNQCGNEQVAKTMAGQISRSSEAVGKQFFHQTFFISQGDQTVTQVPRCYDIQVLPDPPGRSAIVGNRDDSRQIIRFRLQSPEHDRKACASADDDDFGALGQFHIG